MPIEGVVTRFMVGFVDSDQLALIFTGAGAALLAGLGGSPHCALMCGPLACAGLGADRRARRRAAVSWHLGRVFSYGAIGLLLGTLGQGALTIFQSPLARALPWVMALGLLASAFEVGRRLPALPLLRGLPRALAVASARFSPEGRAVMRGMGTPFLPCGLLYGGFLMALATGSPLGGLIVMGAFVLGAIPALALVQFNASRLVVHPRLTRVVRVAAPLLAAGLVAWRTLHAGGAAGPPVCH